MDWPTEAARAWHRITRNILKVSLLPVGEPKSCPLSKLENIAINFIGCTWDLKEKLVYPAPRKLEKVTQQLRHLLTAKKISRQEWERIIGKLVWLVMLNRPLLSCLQYTFREGQCVKPQETFHISRESKKELRTLVALLPLARTNLALPLSTILIAFDASLSSGAVAFTHIPSHLAQFLWTQAQHARFNPTPPPHKNLEAVNIVVSSYKWKKAVVHHWRVAEHIDGLEASAAVLALEWVIRAGVRRSRVLMLTDSLVTMGALQKGRSSAPMMLVRCRRCAALSLAHDVHVTFAYVESKDNPADKYTRLTGRRPGATNNSLQRN